MTSADSDVDERHKDSELNKDSEFNRAKINRVKSSSNDSLSLQNNVKEQQSKQGIPFESGTSDALSPASEQSRQQAVNINENGLFGTIKLRDLKPAKLQDTEIIKLYSLPGDLVLTADQRGYINIWNMNLPNPVPLSVYKMKDYFTALAYNAEKALLAIAYPDLVEIVSIESSEPLFKLTRINTRISDMDFAPDGDSLVMGGVDGVSYRWSYIKERDARTTKARQESLERYLGHSGVISSVKFHTFGRIFFSADWFGTLSSWLLYDSDVYGGAYDKNIFLGKSFSDNTTRVRAARTRADAIDEMIMSKEGKYLLLADEKGMIEIWQVRGFKKILEFSAHKGKIYSLDISDDSKKIVSVGRDGYLRSWKIIDGEAGKDAGKDGTIEVKKSFESTESSLRRVAFKFQNDQTIFAGTDQNRVREIKIPETE